MLLALEKAYAIQQAIIIKKFAIIYSDKELKGPIGKLPRGTTLKVGSLPLGNGTSLPVQIQNRIAYISLDDIVTEESTLAVKTDVKKATGIDHPVLNVHKTDRVDNFTKDNYVTFEYGNSYFLSGDWDKFNRTFHNASASPTTDFSIYAQHRPANLRYYVAIGLSYFHQQDFDKTIRAPLLIGEIYYALIKFEYIALDIGLAAYATGDLQIKIGNPNSSFLGTMFGSGPKLNLRLFPNKFFSLHISARYQYFKTINLDNLEVNGIEAPITFDEMNNFSILAGFSIKLM